MKYSTEYTWYTSYLSNDALWLEDTINWDDVFELTTSEYNLFGVLTAAFFLNTHHFLDWFVKLSTLDALLASEFSVATMSNDLPTTLGWDCSLLFTNIVFSLPSLFYGDFQDVVTTLAFYSPELISALHDSVTTGWLGLVISCTPAACFDLFQDLTSGAAAEFIEYWVMFIPFIFYTLMLVSLARSSALAASVGVHATRIYYYVYSLSAEVRFSFEAALQTFFFVVLYTFMMLATFDDDQEELQEFFNCMCYYFFLFTMAYYLCKYSISWFSFLEASKGGTWSVALITQTLFDVFSMIAFFLRFLVLMIRLNIYDCVDDVLDSYYISMVDFDEEEYHTDVLFSLFTTLMFDTDLGDDRSYLLEDETDLFSDLFITFFFAWGKFTQFWFFILEEIARVSLALYITYLLIFELNTTNRSYTESGRLASTFITFKRRGYDDE